MTAVTKNIVFSTKGLGQSYKFTLAIVPPGAETFKTMTPVAWKVFTLNDGESYQVTWTDSLAGCRAIIDRTTAPTATVKAVEYQPIKAKRSSDLLLDSAKRPPVFHYSEPAPLPGQERARIVNRTGTKVDSIGAGFVTGINTNNEAMNLVLASGPIEDGKEIYVDHTPVAKLWVNLDYNESQLLDANVDNVATIWEQNLLDLSGSEALRASLPRGQAALSSSPTTRADRRLFPTTRLHDVLKITYTAAIAFTSPVLAVAGMKAIVNWLTDRQAFASFASTFKESDNEATLQFMLAPWVSPSSASDAVLQAINANTDDIGRMFLRTHSAAQLTATGTHEMWMALNPASDAWSSPAGPIVPIGTGPTPQGDNLNAAPHAAAPAIQSQGPSKAASLHRALTRPAVFCATSGGGGTWNGGNGTGTGGQWNGGNGGGQWNGGNGTGNGGQWNGGNAGGQWTGGNGTGTGGQWNGGNGGGQWNGGNGSGTGGQWNGGNGGGQWNGGDGAGTGGQWNGGNCGGQWNGGNGTGNGGQWNGGNAGGQWNGGNGTGNGGQWNGGNNGGQWNGGNGTGNGGQWNGGNSC
ncbi:hypothetical protein BV20DRAFT_1054177 [Pilatotrama ljubarskyi]|nr:hypothetical protein BV20DRAFT_1054177 [Pilatotrama ljubarskyi]